MTVASEQNATTRRAVDRADRGEHAAVVVGGDQLAACPRRRAPASRWPGCGGPPRGAAWRAWPGARRAAVIDGRWLIRQTAEGEGDVVAAEAEGVVQRGEVAVRAGRAPWWRCRARPRVEVVEVDRRRHHPVVEREHGGDRLQRAGGAEQVAGHRLGAGHHDPARRASPSRVQHQALGDVAERGRGRVRVDVGDVARRRGRPRAAPAHGPGPAATGRVGLGDVVGSRR